MTTIKYYDHSKERFIDLEKDGCALTDWGRLQDKALFARHPAGFLVFLPPSELEASDEYKEKDPYEVEEGLAGEFHKRRFDCTLELAHEAVKQSAGPPRILDLGCGEGHITARLLEDFAGAEVFGLDYSISAIKYAHEHFRGIDFIVGNAYHAPYQKDYFDLVVCNNLWEHVGDPLLLLACITRLLKPGGCLIISTPSRYRWGNLSRVVRGKPILFMSDKHVTEYSVGQVIEQLQWGGYDTMRVSSKPYKTNNWKFELGKMLFRRFAAWTGSHHQLESTVFYLARRRVGDAR